MAEEPKHESPEGEAGQPERAARPRKPRRSLRRLSVAVLVCVGLTLGLYFTRASTLHPALAGLLEYAAPRLSDYQLSLEGIEGDWLHGLALRGLDLRGPQGASLQHLEVERVDASYELLDLLRGSLAGLKRVEASGVRVELELPPSVAEPAPVSTGTEGWGGLPERLPELDIHDLRLHIQHGPQSYALEQVELSVDAGLETQAVELRVARAESVGAGGTRGLRAAELSLRYRSSELLLDRLLLDGHELLRASRVDLSSLSERALTSRFEFVGMGGALGIEAGLADGRLSVALSGEGLEVERLWSLADGFAFDAGATLGVQGRLELALDDPLALQLDLDLDARGLRYGEWGVERLAASVAARDGLARLRNLVIVDGPNRITSSGLELPLALDDAEALRRIAGDLRVEARDVARLVRGIDLPEGRTIPEHELELALDLAGGVAVLRSGRLELPDGRLLVNAGEFDWVDPGQGRHVSLQLEAEFRDLAPLADILQTAQWGGSLAGHIELEGRLPALAGDLRLQGENVLVAGFPLGALEVAAQATRARVRIDSLRADGERLELDLTGAYDFESGQMEEVALAGRLHHLEAWSEQLEAGGVLELSARLGGDPLQPSGDLVLDGTGVRAAGVALRELHLEASAERGHIQVDALRWNSDQGQLESTLALDLPHGDEGWRVSLNSFSIRSQGKDLALRQPVKLEAGGGTFAIDRLELAGQAGELLIEAHFEEQATSLEVESHALELTPFLQAYLPGGAQLDGIELQLSLQSSSAGLSASGSGRVERMRWAEGGQARALSFEGALADGRLELPHLLVTAGESTFVDAALSLPLDPLAEQPLGPGALSARGRIAWPESQPVHFPLGERVVSVSGGVDADLELSGSWNSLRGHVDLKAPVLRFSPDELLDRYIPGAMGLVGRIELGDLVRIEQLELQIPERGTLSVEGTLATPLDLVALVSGHDAPGTAISDAALLLEASLDVPDAGWLAGFSDDLRRLDGRLRVGATLGGTLAEPQLEAEVELSDAGLRVGDMPQILDLQIALGYARERLTVETCTGEMGAAPFNLQGSVAFDGPEPSFDLTLHGDNLLLARTSSLRLRSDLDLLVTGPMSHLHGAGNLRLRHSRLLSNIDFLAWTGGRGGGVASVRRGITMPSFRSPPLSNMTFDLHVETGEPLEIRGNLVSGAVRVDLRVGGTGEVLTPSGRVFIDESRLRLPSGTLTIRSGIIQFDIRDPFVPRVEIQAGMRRASYELGVTVSGPFDKPEIELTSTPSLAQDELLHLFLTGRLPVENSAFGPAAESVTIYLAKDLIRRIASGSGLEDEESESLVDRFEFVSGEEISKGGVSTFEGKFRLLDDWVSERDSLYLVGERDVWEHFNFGMRLVFKFR